MTSEKFIRNKTALITLIAACLVVLISLGVRQTFGYGYSWGGFESLALHQEFRETGARKYLKLAKDEHLVRFHIGLEDPKDLIADIKQALRHLK